MLEKIGFVAADFENRKAQGGAAEQGCKVAPRKSVVQVYFADVCREFAYYNDLFDLHVGDMVYVDGKLEGLRGKVTDVNYNFKIKVSDYKRVIAVADTDVSGTFYFAERYFLAFKRNVLPVSKVIRWFKAPDKEDDVFVSGSDDTTFLLRDLSTMGVSDVTMERGEEYYDDNRVRYLCLDGTKGYAIVRGREVYEVEFEYNNGEISKLVCSCYCADKCKHEVATMMLLKDVLSYATENYAEVYNNTGYLAAIDKGTLLYYATDGKKVGTITF